MENLEKKIEEAALEKSKFSNNGSYYTSQGELIYQEGYINGTKSLVAKEFHTHALRIEMVAKCAKMQVVLKKSLYTEEEVRSIAIDFFFHWYNTTSGTNTQEGFDKWFKTNKKK